MIYEGIINGKGKKIGIVWSRFNEFIGSKLLDGAKDALIRHEVSVDDIDVYKVPGAYEIPFILKQIANKKKYDAIICIGAVIRGATPHFDFVASEVSKGVAQVSLQSDVPVIFGVLTTDTIEQAIERAGTKSGNKGYQVAMDALEMANLKANI